LAFGKLSKRLKNELLLFKKNILFQSDGYSSLLAPTGQEKIPSKQLM
jgi:hypothetical protein